MATHFIGPGKWPYDDGTDAPFGPDGLQRLANRSNMMSGAGVGYAPDIATRDALVTNGDAFVGLHVYVLANDAVYKYAGSSVWTLVWTGTLVGARLTKTTAQSTSGTANTNTAILWDTEQFDPLTLHSTSVNTSRITVPSWAGGFYSAKAHTRWVASSATAQLAFAVNGTIQTDTVVVVGATAATFSAVAADELQLSGGDFVEVFMLCSGTLLALVPANSAFSLMFTHG